MMNRRGFFGLLAKATLVVATARIPLVSQAAQATLVKFGWLAITINGQKRFIPIWY